MKPKPVLILLCCLALAVAALVLTMKQPGGAGTAQNGPDKGNTASAPMPLLSEEALSRSLSAITLDTGNQAERVELERVRGRWRVIRPHDFAAEPKAIDELLMLLSGLSGVEEDAAVADEPGGRRLTLTNDGKQTTLWLGKRLGAGRAELVLSRGDESVQLFTADDTLHDVLDNLDPTVFLAGKLDAPLMPEVARIELAVQGERSTVHQVDGRWWIGEPGSENPERALVDALPGYANISDYFRLVGLIEVVEHERYRDAQGLASFGLDPPLLSTRFVPKDSASGDTGGGMLLRVGVAADPQGATRYVAVGKPDDPRPAVFTVASEYALSFAQSATSFRDPRVMATPESLVRRVTLKRPAESGFSVQQITLDAGKPPVLVEGDGQPVELDPLACSAVLAELNTAAATDYVEASLGEWELIVSVLITPALGGEPEPFSVYVDPASDDERPTVLVHRGREPVALRIGQAVVAELIEPGALLVDPQPRQ